MVGRADQCRGRRYLRPEGCIGDRVARLGGKTFPSGGAAGAPSAISRGRLRLSSLSWSLRISSGETSRAPGSTARFPVSESVLEAVFPFLCSSECGP